MIKFFIITLILTMISCGNNKNRVNRDRLDSRGCEPWKSWYECQDQYNKDVANKRKEEANSPCPYGSVGKTTQRGEFTSNYSSRKTSVIIKGKGKGNNNSDWNSYSDSKVNSFSRALSTDSYFELRIKPSTVTRWRTANNVGGASLKRRDGTTSSNINKTCDFKTREFVYAKVGVRLKVYNSNTGRWENGPTHTFEAKKDCPSEAHKFYSGNVPPSTKPIAIEIFNIKTDMDCYEYELQNTPDVVNCNANRFSDLSYKECVGVEIEVGVDDTVELIN